MKISLKRAFQSPSFRGGLFYAAFWSVFGVINPFMNLELSRRGFSGLEIGAIGSIRGVVVLLTATAFSRMADKHNIRVKMLRWFMVASAVGVTLFGFPKTFPWLVAAAVFMAIWQSPLDSLGNSILVRMANKHRVDYGMMTFWGAVAFATTNLVGGAIWERVGFSWIYVIGGGVYLLVSLIAGTLEEPEEDPAQASAVVEMEPERKAFKPVILLVLAGYFLFNLAFLNAFGFTAPILDLRGANEFLIGLVGTVVGVGGMIVRRAHRKILQRFSMETVMQIAILMGIIPIVVFGWVESVTLLILFSAFRGAAWGLFSLSSIHFIDQQASVQNASTLQSTLILLGTLSGIISSTLSGYLFDKNPTLIFLISTIAAVVALVIIGVVRWMNHREQPLPEIAKPLSAE